MEIKLNIEQKLYVIPCGGGYTCFGFDNAFRDATQLASIMAMPGEAPTAEMHGTIECYQRYRKLIGLFGNHIASKRTWFSPGTPEKVRRVLEAAIKSSNKFGPGSAQILRIFSGNTETGEDWCNEYDTIGYVGRTGGTLKSPILMEPLLDDGEMSNTGSGGAIMTDRILRIVDCRTGLELYRAENYQLPSFEVGASAHEGYVSSVSRDGKVWANFRKHEDALEYISFLQGFRVHRPYRTVADFQREMQDAA